MKTANVFICEWCDRELFRKEEGDFQNPDGSYSSSTKLNFVDSRQCPVCARRRKNGRRTELH